MAEGLKVWFGTQIAVVRCSLTALQVTYASDISQVLAVAFGDDEEPASTSTSSRKSRTRKTESATTTDSEGPDAE